MLFSLLSPKKIRRPSVTDIDILLSNRALFDKTIYTPIDSCISELKRRRKDASLQENVQARLGNDLPEPFKTAPRAVSFRQLATSNYEMRRFFSLVDALDDIEPLFWEYYEDKFTSNNEWKRSLGKLFFYSGRGKKGGAKIESQTVVDFNTYNGKKISEVKTLWGESLIDFHHTLFNTRFKPAHAYFYDASDWFSNHGSTAHGYYESFISLFVRDGVLFENFLLDSDVETPFVRDIFLPAFLKVWEETGQKPLIVALEPTDIEGESFWLCHPSEDKQFVLDKMEKPSE